MMAMGREPPAPRVAISDGEFQQFQRFIYETAGIALSEQKKSLVGDRLAGRVQALRLSSYAEYFRLLASGEAPAEVQIAVDLLTTNETYFFREAPHFALLRELAIAARGRADPFRVWSAASSTGEEAYSIAMVLADCMAGLPWEIVGSDISARVLERARIGHYPLERARHIPETYLKRFCLKGVREQEGTLLITRELRRRVNFLQVNLNSALPQLGSFDVIFLRNVLIYFNEDTKRQVVGRLLAALKPAGHFLISHSESLHGMSLPLQRLSPSIYRLSRRGGGPRVP
jgi:chemotaxis protein methyltransferase CheR